MIKIEINTSRYKATVTGHANAEESEQWREICAGVSALVQSMMYTVQEVVPEGGFKSIEYRPDPGNLFLRFYPEPWAEKETIEIMRIYSHGLELLTRSHPQSVEMIWDGRSIKGGQENE